MTDESEREGKAVSEDKDKPHQKKGDDIGKALRSAYDRTLKEDVPSELLDLLGKLK
ncbi:MAG: NepR family anti-sigma factor [Parasphingopyxis sp.]|nr:hypothetical protein [Sphingomonadales bacterium]